MALKISEIKPLYDAMVQYTSWGYSNMGSDYSVTTLITPPRIVQLRRRYAELIAEQPKDLAQSLASFKGTAIHDALEKNLWKHTTKHPGDGYITERRLWDRICDRKISGQFDLLRGGELYDWKTCSVWKKVKKQFTEWEIQLNLYAYMLSLVGVDVTYAAVIAMYSDFDKHKTFQKDYPQQPYDLIPVKVWPIAKSKQLMFESVERQKAAESMPDEELPECTSKDMWETPTMYALYKFNGDGTLQQKASRVLESKVEIDKWAKWKGLQKREYEIQVRPGSRVRCVDWCDCNIVCDQYQQYMEGE